MIDVNLINNKSRHGYLTFIKLWLSQTLIILAQHLNFLKTQNNSKTNKVCEMRDFVL